MARKQKRIYFAHSKLDYRSAQATAARSLIVRLRPNAIVVDPSAVETTFTAELDARYVAGATTTRAAHDAIYRARIAAVDEVIVLERENHIGRGVYREVHFALKRGLPCWVVRDGDLLPVTSVKLVDGDDWTYYFGRVVVKRGFDKNPRRRVQPREPWEMAQ